MNLILDTHTLIWVGEGNPKLSPRAKEAIGEVGNEIFVSVVTAWEYVELQGRNRIPRAAAFDVLRRKLHFSILDLPAQIWRISPRLPKIHQDPIDRMLIAHAIVEDLTLVTIDADMRRYPLRTIW